MNICFIIDPWEELKPDDDSTLRLMHECLIRDHTVGFMYPGNLTIRKSQTYGFVKKIRAQEKYSSNFNIFHSKIKYDEQFFPLSGFDAIFIRSNPPIDPIMLNFLDSVQDDTFILNDITGLRKANNKLYSASFDDPENEIIPVTYVSKNKEYLKDIIQNSERDKMILKPLQGFGGSGVIVLEKSAKQSISSLLDFYITGKTESHYVILQEFVEGVEQGDIRVLMLNGKILGAYKRVPRADDVRANLKVGATAVKHQLSKREKSICERIGPKLVADGLYFVGIDLINNKLIEINVISPGGITKINKFNRVKLQKQVIDFIEDVVSSKENAIHRKRELKKLIDEA